MMIGIGYILLAVIAVIFYKKISLILKKRIGAMAYPVSVLITVVIPGINSNEVLFAKDLNPCNSNFFKYIFFTFSTLFVFYNHTLKPENYQGFSNILF